MSQNILRPSEICLKTRLKSLQVSKVCSVEAQYIFIFKFLFQNFFIYLFIFLAKAKLVRHKSKSKWFLQAPFGSWLFEKRWRCNRLGQENLQEKKRQQFGEKPSTQMDSKDVKCAAEIACEVVWSRPSKKKKTH